jgi:cell wall-associated NlpC family hydrolase
MITVGVPMVAATAEPKPTTKQLAAEVEKLYSDIETLSEQYNGERVRLTAAQRSADVAKKTLAKSASELAERRQKAAYLAQNSYMNGGFGSTPFALMGGIDPETYLDQASTTYALEMQQGQEVTEVANAMEAAERAKAGAAAREAEVKKLLSSLESQRKKITKLVKKSESKLYSTVAASVSGGVARRVDFPVIGSGKAAQAARWALSQQGKPYVWGAAGPGSFDCSGLTMAAYRTVGISLPHYTGNQWTSGTHISMKDLRPGDLVFFYSDLHHMGMYIGGGYMVHAPHTGDVVRVASLAGRPIAGAVRVAD